MTLVKLNFETWSVISFSASLKFKLLSLNIVWDCPLLPMNLFKSQIMIPGYNPPEIRIWNWYISWRQIFLENFKGGGVNIPGGPTTLPHCRFISLNLDFIKLDENFEFSWKFPYFFCDPVLCHCPEKLIKSRLCFTFTWKNPGRGIERPGKYWLLIKVYSCFQIWKVFKR